MIDRICAEFLDRVEELQTEVETIYFGGGTPSLLLPEELKQLMDTLHSRIDFNDVKEITLEANPDDITPSNLESWRAMGINRLSIGIQSFKQVDLNWMNRAHTVTDAEQCVALAKEAGFHSFSVDLIYGLPDLTLQEWEDHLLRVIASGVDHISAYCLTVEDKTVLHKMVNSGKLIPANEDIQSDQFELLVSTLTSAGFEHYEVSNFAKSGAYARHNTAYWTGQSYLGVGPSAHSFNGHERRWNCSNNQQYLKGGQSGWFEIESLGPKERWNELLLTGLRTNFGVNLSQLYAINNPTALFFSTINDFIDAGWLIQKKNQLFLTTTGRLKADHIASSLFLIE